MRAAYKAPFSISRFQSRPNCRQRKFHVADPRGAYHYVIRGRRTHVLLHLIAPEACFAAAYWYVQARHAIAIIRVFE